MYFADNGAWMIMSPSQGASIGQFGGEWPKNPANAGANGNRTYIDTGKGSTWEVGIYPSPPFPSSSATLLHSLPLRPLLSALLSALLSTLLSPSNRAA
jgi:hypothetical protein